MRHALSMSATLVAFVALFSQFAIAQVEPKSTQLQATQAGAIANTPFPVVAFVREVEMSFPQSSNRVCPMFDPRTQPDQLGIQLIETLYEPSDGTLKGLTLRNGFRPGARAHGGEFAADRFYTTIVIHHDIAAGVLKYLNIYGNIEDEQITITCISGENSGTLVTFQNRILGFHNYGVEAVTNWVNDGGIEESALEWRDAIIEMLET